MKKVSGLLKIGGAALLVPLVLLLSLLPAQAIGGTDVQLSLEGAGGPDLEVNADATYLALVYYEQDATNGRNGVYLKSAKASEGWASPRLLGFGSNPQVAFKPGAGSNVVYAVWVNADDTAIEATRCILNLTSAPTCGLAREVRKLPSGSVGALAEPDIVVDSSNVLHVAWQNAAVIETARSSNADNVDSWVITSGGLLPTLCGGGQSQRAGAGDNRWQNSPGFFVWRFRDCAQLG